MAWISLGPVSELPREGEVVQLYAGGRTFCVSNVGGEYFALDDRCPHMGGSLGQGTLDGDCVSCSWHGWEFDARTGHAKQGYREGVRSFVVKLEGDEAFVEVR